MTPRKAPEAVLVALAEAVDKAWDDTSVPASAVKSALDAYRAAVAPLRTRAEVDAEIATLVRDYHRHITRPGWKEAPDWDSFSGGEKTDLNRLCSEPTADETEDAAGADTFRVCPRCKFGAVQNGRFWCNCQGAL